MSEAITNPGNIRVDRGGVHRGVHEAAMITCTETQVELICLRANNIGTSLQKLKIVPFL